MLLQVIEECCDHDYAEAGVVLVLQKCPYRILTSIVNSSCFSSSVERIEVSIRKQSEIAVNCSNTPCFVLETVLTILFLPTNFKGDHLKPCKWTSFPFILKIIWSLSKFQTIAPNVRRHWIPSTISNSLKGSKWKSANRT